MFGVSVVLAEDFVVVNVVLERLVIFGAVIVDGVVVAVVSLAIIGDDIVVVMGLDIVVSVFIAGAVVAE